MHIGARLKQQRQQRGWSQQELADQLHISRQSISKWEQGTALPSFANVVAMSDLFGVSLDELIRKDEALMRELKDAQRVTPVEKIVWSSIGLAAVVMIVMLAMRIDFNVVDTWFNWGAFVLLIVWLFTLNWRAVNQLLSRKSVVLGIVVFTLYLIPFIYSFIQGFIAGFTGQ